MAKKWSFLGRLGKNKVNKDKHLPPESKTKGNAEKAKHWEPPPLPQEKPAHGAPAKSNVAGSALHEQVANRNSASPTSWRKPPLPQDDTKKEPSPKPNALDRGAAPTQRESQMRDNSASLANRQSETALRHRENQMRAPSSLRTTLGTEQRDTAQPSVRPVLGTWQAVGKSVVGMAHRKMNPPVGCQARTVSA